MSDTSPLNRREFLGSSAKNAASMAASVVGLGSVATLGAMDAGPQAEVRVGVIGLRGYGQTLLSTLCGLPRTRVVGLCDVDEGVLRKAGQDVAAVTGYAPRMAEDFRTLLDIPELDAVVIATPDHWHALMTLHAVRAGKDVYLEPPVAHTLGEGKLLVAEAARTDRIVGVGLQQRGGDHFQSAIEYLRQGHLGTLHLAKAWTVHQRKPIGTKRATEVPPGVNYDLWLGPAPERAFQPNRFHYNWHWFWDYGSGELGNWGVHMLDVARWGLGVDWPESIAASGGKFAFCDDQETPDTLTVQFGFREASVVWEHRLWSAHAPEGRSTAAAFHGEQGTLIVDRGGWKVYGRKDAPASGAQGDLVAKHLAQFLSAVATRTTPAVDLSTGHISSSLCHLGNAAYRLGRTLKFDAATQHCVGDPRANELLTATYRTPWSLV